MAILNMTTADAILKELYNGQQVQNLVYKNNPLLALLPKMEEFYGRNHPLPITYGGPQNRSATFSTAVAKSTSSQHEQFLLTRVKDYSLAFIDGETMKAAANDKGAFIDAATSEVDSAIRSLTNNIAYQIGRDSSGYKAQVNAEPSEAATTTITLKNSEDIVAFEVGQTIVIHSAKSGGSQRIYDTGVTDADITAVDRSAGTITLDEAYTSSGTIAADDYLFVDGDRGIGSSGLEDWIPDSAPSSGDSHFGVDRSADTNRLAGVRTTGTGMNIEEALIQGAYDVGREGGMPDFCFVNFKQMQKLIKSLGSKVSYVDVKANAEVGFRGVEVHGPNGTMVVLNDRNIRDQRAYMLELDSWKLASLGPLVQLLDTDGKFLRQSTADAYEVRVGSYYQLGCNAPGHNGVITLD